MSLAATTGYHGAGTVEYLVGDDGAINFLEVNTRIQVEHPVTEAVTGLDLVELQLRVAAGEPLGFSQDDVTLDGHAIELRLVAEEPSAGWIPSSGSLDAFSVPASLRCDAAVTAGSVVPADYDSLLAKLIVHDTDRTAAIAKLSTALAAADVGGLSTNLAMLRALLAEPNFNAGDVPISYLDDHPAVVAAAPVDDDTLMVHLVATVLADRRQARLDDQHWGFLPADWRAVPGSMPPTDWVEEGSGRTFSVVLGTVGDATTVRVVPVADSAGTGDVADDEIEAVEHLARLIQVPSDATGARDLVEIDGMRVPVDVEVAGEQTRVAAGGATTWRRLPRFADHEAAAASSGPVAPLPGTVLSVHVSTGDEVADGDVLVVLEAMKMEHTITAAGPATVSEVPVAAGDRVDAGDSLVVLEAST